MRITYYSIALLLTLASCSRPEGPAERIGRSIDQLTTDIQEISDDAEERGDEKAKERPSRYREAPDGLLDPIAPSRSERR